MKLTKNLLTVALGAAMTVSVAQANTQAKQDEQLIEGISNASLVTAGVVLGALAVLDNNDDSSRSNPTTPTTPETPETPDTTGTTSTTTTTSTGSATTTTTATAATTN